MREEYRSLKIYLIHAIGKFTRYLNQDSDYVQELLMYMIHEEFKHGDARLENGGQKTMTGSLLTVRAILGVLVHEVWIYLYFFVLS